MRDLGAKGAFWAQGQVAGERMSSAHGSSAAFHSSPFFPRLERAQTVPLRSVDGPSPTSPVNISPIQVSHWQAVGHNLATVFQQVPMSPTSPWTPSPLVGHKIYVSSAAPTTPTPSSPISPILVEQWQTVGQRLAAVFQNQSPQSSWASPTTSPVASRPKQ